MLPTALYELGFLGCFAVVTVLALVVIALVLHRR